VSTNWTRWESGTGWQRTKDTYLQADLTPITAKVGGGQALRAQRELQHANVEAARAVVDATGASFEQNGRDIARQERLLHGGSSSTEASGKLALLPPHDATGNFTKVVQRITLKIAIEDAGGLADRLAK
jgi:membrane fusion protein, multidrug efflux system